MLRKLLFVVGMSLFSVPTVASAATYLVSISGNVSGGTDTPGMFGTPGASLVGLPFSVSFSYDTTLGVREKGPFSDTLSGGSMDGTFSPSSGAIFTLGGKSFNFSGQSSTSINEANDPGSDGYSYYAFHDQIPNPYGTLLTNLTLFIWHPNSPQSDLDSPYTGGGLSGFGQAAISSQRSGSFNTSLLTQFDTFTVTASSTGGATGGAAGAVPEPAAWSMLIAGFGMIGGAMRRRSAKTMLAPVS